MFLLSDFQRKRLHRSAGSQVYTDILQPHGNAAPEESCVLSFQTYSDKWCDDQKVLLHPDSRFHAKSVLLSETHLYH